LTNPRLQIRRAHRIRIEMCALLARIVWVELPFEGLDKIRRRKAIIFESFDSQGESLELYFHGFEHSMGRPLQNPSVVGCAGPFSGVVDSNKPFVLSRVSGQFPDEYVRLR
jgi:hypothetical protein